MGAVTDVTTAVQFDAAVAGPATVTVAYFWADWCAPCKHLDVVVQELAKRHAGVQFLRIEAEEVDEVTEKCGVATVPYFVFYTGGKLTDRLEGADPAGLTARVAALAAAAAAPAAAPPQPQQAAANVVDAESRIKQLLADHSVVLFMKGNAEAPRCGFSRKVVDALVDVGAPVHTVDILQDEQLRQAVKTFSNWPTYPQLYVCSELVGGCDIVMEMHQSGELKQLLREKLGAPAASSKQQQNGEQQSSSQAQASSQQHNGQQEQQNGTAVPIRQRIEQLLASSPCMLFMKGSPDAPRCGFSSKVVAALQSDGIPFQAFDILGDQDVRQGLKEYSSWPTYPQLYVKGELVGGCDIVLEMHEAGELKGAVEEMLHRTAA